MVNFNLYAWILILGLGCILTEKSRQNEFLEFLSDTSIDFKGLAADSNTTLKLAGIKCFWLEPNTLSVFDLKNLKRPFTQKYDYNFTLRDEVVLYNFCEDILPKCESSSSQISSFIINNMTECTRFAGQQQSTNNWTLLNTTDSNGGFEITLNQGQPCKSDPLQNYTTSYVMKCSSTMKEGEYNLTQSSVENFDKNKCKNQLEFTSLEACPKMNFYAVWNFLQTYKVFFGAILIAIGLFEIFLGAKLVVVTIFLTTCVLSVTVVFIFLFQFVIPKGANPAVIWVVLTIAVICGLVLGYLISKYNKFLIGMILGGYMGYILGLVLYNTALNHIKANPVLVLWGCILICIGISATIAYFLVTFIMILATSFCGAYAFIRGVSLYAQGFPNESYVVDLIRNEEWDTLNNVLTPVVYAYMCGWFFLFAIGIVFQIKTRSKDPEEKEQDDNAKYFLKKK